MFTYNLFDELLYQMTIFGGDEEDIKYITNYKKNCIELGLIKKNDYFHIKTA